MDEDISGKGDPLKTLQLLWGRAPVPKRGPKAKLDLADVVGAAIAIADADGLAAVTTRRVAEKLGISPMSFYTYVPGKNELLDLMLDAVIGETGRIEGETWRERLEHMAGAMWGFYMRHTWVLQLGTHRPVLGPNTLRAWESALSAVDGIGLDEIEMDRVCTLISDYVIGAVRGAARESMVKEATGMSDTDWWVRVVPFLETVDFSAYPVASRVGPVTGEAYGAHDPAGSFRFGLERLLDGLAVFIEGKNRGSDEARS